MTEVLLGGDGAGRYGTQWTGAGRACSGAAAEPPRQVVPA